MLRRARRRRGAECGRPPANLPLASRCAAPAILSELAMPWVSPWQQSCMPSERLAGKRTAWGPSRPSGATLAPVNSSHKPNRAATSDQFQGQRPQTCPSCWGDSNRCEPVGQARHCMSRSLRLRPRRGLSTSSGETTQGSRCSGERRAVSPGAWPRGSPPQALGPARASQAPRRSSRSIWRVRRTNREAAAVLEGRPSADRRPAGRRSASTRPAQPSDGLFATPAPTQGNDTHHPANPDQDGARRRQRQRAAGVQGDRPPHTPHPVDHL